MLIYLDNILIKGKVFDLFDVAYVRMKKSKASIFYSQQKYFVLIRQKMIFIRKECVLKNILILPIMIVP